MDVTLIFKIRSISMNGVAHTGIYGGLKWI